MKESVKARDIYSNYLMVAGLTLLLLGVGNWIIGALQSAKYQSLIQKSSETGLEDSYRSFQELDRHKNEQLLRRINKDREKYNAARVKLDFYSVVLSGGRLLLFLGLLLTFFGVIRVIREDTLTKMRRLAARPTEQKG